MYSVLVVWPEKSACACPAGSLWSAVEGMGMKCRHSDCSPDPKLYLPCKLSSACPRRGQEDQVLGCGERARERSIHPSSLLQE